MRIDPVARQSQGGHSSRQRAGSEPDTSDSGGRGPGALETGARSCLPATARGLTIAVPSARAGITAGVGPASAKRRTAAPSASSRGSSSESTPADDRPPNVDGFAVPPATPQVSALASGDSSHARERSSSSSSGSSNTGSSSNAGGFWPILQRIFRFGRGGSGADKHVREAESALAALQAGLAASRSLRVELSLELEALRRERQRVIDARTCRGWLQNLLGYALSVVAIVKMLQAGVNIALRRNPTKDLVTAGFEWVLWVAEVPNAQLWVQVRAGDPCMGSAYPTLASPPLCLAALRSPCLSLSLGSSHSRLSAGFSYRCCRSGGEKAGLLSRVLQNFYRPPAPRSARCSAASGASAQCLDLLVLSSSEGGSRAAAAALEGGRRSLQTPS